MASVLDKIISKLSPHVIKMLSEEEASVENSSEEFSERVQDTLNKIDAIHLDQQVASMTSEAAVLYLEITDFKSKLSKYQNQLARIQQELESDPNLVVLVKKLKLYNAKLEDSQLKLDKIMKKVTDQSALQLFQNTEKIMTDIAEIELKITLMKKKLEVYEGLAPNMVEAQKMIEDKKNELLLIKKGSLVIKTENNI